MLRRRRGQSVKIKERGRQATKIRSNPSKSVSSVFPSYYEGRSRTNQKSLNYLHKPRFNTLNNLNPSTPQQSKPFPCLRKIS